MKRKATYVKNNVKVDVSRSNSEVCLIVAMKVNDIDAYLFDFGTMKDLDPDNAPSSGCGNRSFIPKRPMPQGILDKYNLTPQQGEDLLDLLEKELHIGYCKRCR